MPLPRLLPALALPAVLLLAGCSSSSAAPDTPGTGGAAVPLAGAAPPPGGLTQDRLEGLLLQTADLPALPKRSVYAGAAATTQTPPQLALCQEPVPTAPHQLANVLAKGGGVGQVQVFEVLQAYADPAAAVAAYEQSLAGARACPTYARQGRTFTVEDLTELTVPGADRALHYRLTTPDVVGGDVRSLAVRGRYVVLVTGYGAPPAGQSLLDYQADVLGRATARLG